MKFEGPPALPHGLLPPKTPNIVHSSPGIPLTCSLFYYDTVSFLLFIYLFILEGLVHYFKKTFINFQYQNNYTVTFFFSQSAPQKTTPKRIHFKPIKL